MIRHLARPTPANAGRRQGAQVLLSPASVPQGMTPSASLSRRGVLQSMALGAIFSASGCRHVKQAPPRLTRIGDAPAFVVSRPSIGARGENAGTVGDWVLPLLPPARRTTEARGFSFVQSVAIVVHAEISSFVEATGQVTPQLRAWSTWSAVHLLARAFWRDASDRAARARLVHELVHVGMFHAFLTEAAAQQAQVPFFWREAAASVIAEQAFARMPLHDVIARSTGHNPLRQRGRVGALDYGAAHHFGAYLQQQLGPRIFAEVTQMAVGEERPNSLERALALRTGQDLDGLWRAVCAAA